jgi:hypothetical protein
MTTRIIPHGTFRVRKQTRKGWPHDDFISAQEEAEKLAALTPGSTFIVLQEVARVTGGKGVKRAHP